MKFLRSFAKSGSGSSRKEILEEGEECEVDLSIIRGIRAQYRGHSTFPFPLTGEVIGTPSPPSPLLPEQLALLSPEDEAGTRRKVDVRASRRNSVHVARTAHDFYKYSEVVQKKSSGRVIKLTSASTPSSRRGGLAESVSHASSSSLDGSDGPPEEGPASPAASTLKAPPRRSLETHKSLTLILPTDTSPTSTLDWEPAQDVDARYSPGNQPTPYGAYFVTSNSMNSMRSSSSSTSPLLPWTSPAILPTLGAERDGLCGSCLYYGPVDTFVPEPRLEAPQSDEDACVYLTEEVAYLQDQIWRVRKGLPTGSTAELDTKCCKSIGEGTAFTGFDNEYDSEDSDSSVDIEQELRELAEEQQIADESSQLESEILWLRTEVVAFRQLLTELEVKVFLKKKAEQSDPAAHGLLTSRKASWDSRRSGPKLPPHSKGEPSTPPTGPPRVPAAAPEYTLDPCQEAVLSELLSEMQEERKCVEELCRLQTNENTMAELDLLCKAQESLAFPGASDSSPDFEFFAAPPHASPSEDPERQPPAAKHSLAIPPAPGRGGHKKLPWSRVSQSKILPLRAVPPDDAKDHHPPRRSPSHLRSMSMDSLHGWIGMRPRTPSRSADFVPPDV